MSYGKPTLLFLTAAIAVAFLSILPLKAQHSGHEAKDNAAKIAATLQNMRATSKQLVAIRTQEYHTGAIDIVTLLTAQRRLLELELQLAQTANERMKSLSEQFQLAKETETHVVAQYKQGSARQGDVLQSQLARMQVELSILNETR